MSLYLFLSLGSSIQNGANSSSHQGFIFLMHKYVIYHTSIISYIALVFSSYGSYQKNPKNNPSLISENPNETSILSGPSKRMGKSLVMTLEKNSFELALLDLTPDKRKSEIPKTPRGKLRGLVVSLPKRA